MMKFHEALIMVGPAGVFCAHSIINKKTGRPMNNHICVSESGYVICRGPDFTLDVEVFDSKLYLDGDAEIPDLNSISETGEVTKAKISKSMISENWYLK